MSMMGTVDNSEYEKKDVSRFFEVKTGSIYLSTAAMKEYVSWTASTSSSSTNLKNVMGAALAIYIAAYLPFQYVST